MIVNYQKKSLFLEPSLKEQASRLTIYSECLFRMVSKTGKSIIKKSFKKSSLSKSGLA